MEPGSVWESYDQLSTRDTPLTAMHCWSFAERYNVIINSIGKDFQYMNSSLYSIFSLRAVSFLYLRSESMLSQCHRVFES